MQPGPTLTVTTLDPHNDGACTTDDCSFQEALAAANANADPNTITFSPGVTGVISPSTSAGLFITSPLTIQGPGADALTFDGGDKGRVLHINGGDVVISRVTISGGNADGYNHNAPGGGIYHSGGNLTVDNCRVVQNRTANYGGGIYHVSPGTLTLTSCTFGGGLSSSHNSAAYGGALFNVSGSGAVTISGCYFLGNSAPNGGGAINNAGTITATNCTFTGNTADAGGGGAVNMIGYTSFSGCAFYLNSATYGGGGIYVYTAPYNRNTILTNCTFYLNSSPTAGGAVYNVRGTTKLTNCTIYQNTAPNGAGSGVATFVADTPEGSGVTDVGNSIIAGNKNSDVDATGATSRSYGCVSSYYNLIGSGSSTGAFTEDGSGDRTGLTIAQLQLDDDLKDNGGPTPTLALRPGSPAIDAGENEDYPAPPTDQRGYGRNGHADIGAFEYHGLLPVTLGNISTRLLVQGGDNILIGGFIVTGTQPKRLIVRGMGPSLPVSGTLANPLLELYNGDGTLIASNDNWRTNGNANEIQASGIAPSNDLEAVLLGDLNPGAYTAAERGADGGTGIGLLELYDLDRSVNSKLANISTRGLVQGGDNVLIGGFIVQGTQPARLIVRALGPSLPLNGRLGDPSLEIYNGNGDLIGANNNWRETQEAEISATGIPPSNDLESAIIGIVQPDAYTAVVRGLNGGTGIGVVEIYGLQ